MTYNVLNLAQSINPLHVTVNRKLQQALELISVVQLCQLNSRN